MCAQAVNAALSARIMRNLPGSHLPGSFGAPAKAESSRVITAVCKIASENDGPQTNCNGTRAAVANNKENGNRYESSSTPTRNL